MQDKFYNWYKKSFDNLIQEPPAEAWEEIVDSLDKKDKTSSKKFYLKWMTGGLVLLLTGSISWMFLSKENRNAAISENAKQESFASSITISANESMEVKPIERTTIQKNNIGIEEALIVDKQQQNSKRINENRKLETYSDKGLHQSDIIKTSTAVSFVADSGNIQKENRYALSEQTESEKIKNKSNNQLILDSVKKSDSEVVTMFLQQENETLLYVDSMKSESNNKNMLDDTLLNKHIVISNLLPTGFYFGNSFILNNSWLLNHDTYDGLKKSGLNETNMYFGHAYALIAGYNFSDYYSFQAEGLIYNKQGQKYKDYVNGKSISRDELLTYRQFNIILKKKSSRLICNGNIPASFNTILGFHYAYLKSAYQVINKESVSASENYRKNNYGVILGIEFETYIHERWMLAADLRSDIGLKNIYAGTQKSPADFKKTYNSSLEVNFTVGYFISSKN